MRVRSTATPDRLPPAEPGFRTILTVSDPDAVFDQAVRAGAASIVNPVTEQHGWRGAHCRSIRASLGDWEAAALTDSELRSASRLVRVQVLRRKRRKYAPIMDIRTF